MQAIDKYLQSYESLSGAVLVAPNDRMLLKKEYRFVDYAFTAANDDKTKFPLASNTKMFTAVAIMLESFLLRKTLYKQ